MHQMTPTAVSDLDRLVDASIGRYTAFLQQLLTIPTPRMCEHEAVRFVGKAFAAAGLEPEYFEGEGIGEPTPHGLPLNLFAARPGAGGGRSLLLEAHMDTVPPGDESRWEGGPWSGRIEGGRIYARGAHDDRVGVAMLWMTADLLKQLGVVTAGDLYFLVTTEEEYSAGGMRAYLKRPGRVRPDAHLAVDGNQAHYAIVGHAAALTFEIRIPGGWGSLFHRKPEAETNPIELAAKLLGSLHDFESEVRRRLAALEPDPRWPAPFVAATQIQSRGWFSNVPEECSISGFANLFPPMTIPEYRELLEQWVGKWSRDFNWLRSRPPVIEWGPLEVPFLLTPETSDFYRALADCHQKSFGAPLRPRHMGGWGDMRLLGCPNLIFYGPGGGGGDHNYNEYFELADLAPMLKTLASLALEWSGTRP